MIGIGENIVSYNGDGVATEYNYPFKIFKQQQLKVYVGQVLQTFTTHYSLSGIGSDNGGIVTFVTAPPSGTNNVVLERIVAIEQTTDYPLAGKFPATNVENDLDLRTMADMQLDKDVKDRVIRLTQFATLSGGNYTITDTAANRANKLIGFSANGEAIQLTAAAGVTAPLTPGSVAFIGANGLLAQDNANLFYDDTNNRLGLGTATPSERLHLASGKIRIDSNGQIIWGANGTLGQIDSTGSGGNLRIIAPGGNGQITLMDNPGNVRLTLTTAGRLTVPNHEISAHGGNFASGGASGPGTHIGYDSSIVEAFVTGSNIGTGFVDLRLTGSNLRFYYGATPNLGYWLTSGGIFVVGGIVPSGANTGDLVLANTKAYRINDAGGTARAIVTLDAGAITSIGDTNNSGGIVLNPGTGNTRISSGILALGTTVTSGAGAGELVIGNIKAIRAVDNAGTSTHRMIELTTTDQVLIGGGAPDIRWGKPLVALGGGSTATLGTIGGSGPATVTQNAWMRVINSAGVAFWVPAWV